jgi:hypothetical protein
MSDGESFECVLACSIGERGDQHGAV